MTLIKKQKSLNFFSKIISFNLYKNKNLKFRKVYNVKTFLRNKKERLLNINGNIEFCFNKNIKKDYILFNKQNLVKSSFISFFLIKNMLFKALNRKKQYFYSILNLVSVLQSTVYDLNKNEIFLFSSFFSKKNLFLNRANFFQEILFLPEFGSVSLNKKKYYVTNLIWFKYLKAYTMIHLQLYFIFIISNLQQIAQKSNILFLPTVTSLENGLISEYLVEKKESGINLKTLIYRKELISLFLGRTTFWNIFVKNNVWTSFIFERLFVKNRLSFLKLGASSRINSKFDKKVSLNLVYCITRLEEKFKNVKEIDEKTSQTILALRNLLLKKKTDRLFRNNYVLSDLKFLRSIKKQTKKTSFSSFFMKNNFTNVETKKIKININKKQHQLTPVGLWKEKRLEENKSFVSLKNFPQIFSLILGTPTSLIFINALTLTKFGFPRNVKGARRFLTRIERDLIQRYKYVAVYIQDFVRVCFFSFFLKKPTFLANFIGFQIAKLTRNRKETSLIRFIIKIIKIFAAQRREITAIKIEFKGRVNRWRRTKIIKGARGVISYVKFDSRIEFGSGKTITRKGTLGIRLWFAYKLTFVPVFREVLLSYILYSQILKAKKIDQFLERFQHKLS